MKKSYLISPDFTEETVSLMVQILLTIPRFPAAPFALVPLSKKDEVIYGADAYIDSLKPIYIQFKRSFAYPEYSSSKIIKDRKKLKVNYSPRTLFFELRNKKPTHKDYQHNVLYDLKTKLEENGIGQAFYVAPLFLNRTAYLKAVHISSLLSWRPWYLFSEIPPFYFESTGIISNTGSIRFQNIPILKEHIVIPPHTRVTTYKHRYSYLEDGNEVCFHNPTKLDESQTLGQVIYDFLKFRKGKPSVKMINLQQSVSLLNNLKEGLFKEEKILQKETMLDKWVAFGDKLRTTYEIFQFMLIKLKDE